MRCLLSSILVFLILFSCNSKEYRHSEIYVGAYRTIDQLVPYPYILQQKKDSTLLFDTRGHLVGKLKNKALQLDSELVFGQKHWKVINAKKESLVIWDSNDSDNFLRYEDGDPILKFAALFKKIEKEDPIDIQKLRTDLNNSIWNYKLIGDENTNPNDDLDIEKVFHFKKDSVAIFINYFYQGLKTVSEYENKAFEIFQIDTVNFLSFQKEDDNPQPIYQIIKYTSDKLELKDFSSSIVKTNVLQKSSLTSDQFNVLTQTAVLYANCFDGYQGEYYFENVTHNKGNNYIIEKVNVDAPDTDKASGYITVHFNVNCNGDVGRFGLIQMDRTYKKMSFSKAIVSHVLNKVRELNDFPSTYSNSDWLMYKDVHAFLMFKVENGKIIDLCP